MRAGTLAEQTHQKVAGVVENMSSFPCPHCGEPMDLFGMGGGAIVAETLTRQLGTDVPLLGQIPFDVALREGGDSGQPLVLSTPDAPASQALLRIAETLGRRPRGLAGMSLGITPAEPRLTVARQVASGSTGQVASGRRPGVRRRWVGGGRRRRLPPASSLRRLAARRRGWNSCRDFTVSTVSLRSMPAESARSWRAPLAMTRICLSHFAASAAARGSRSGPNTSRPTTAEDDDLADPDVEHAPASPLA